MCGLYDKHQWLNFIPELENNMCDLVYLYMVQKIIGSGWDG